MTLSVLVVEDDASLRGAIHANLEHAGYQVHDAKSGEEALKIIPGSSFDIVLCDYRMPGMDGISFIQRCKEITSKPAIVLITAYGDSDTVLKAMRAGAYDHLPKPFSGEDLILAIRKIEEREKLSTEKRSAKNITDGVYNFSSIIAESASMKSILETVGRIAQFSTTVLLTGESGTGKELIARAIHYNSPRKNGPFVAINCGAIPENLMESELFGHRKGSFTDATRDKKGLFEEANGGTLLLDEIGELPLHLQVKLLRALQEQKIRPVGDENLVPIDVRIIAATLRDLEKDVSTGRFRDDLFYRLNVVSVHIPPLRERIEDIPVLVEHFRKKQGKRLGLKVQKFGPEVLKCLTNYPWRGNVRELENCVERALVLAETDTVTIDALPEHIRQAGGVEDRTKMPLFEDGNLSIKTKTRDLEIALILKALEKTNGNRTHAAKVLEISHRALLYKLKEYGIGEKKE